MERWLTKARVLSGLCAVLLVAALNRQDPMVYAMFLILTVVLVLGYALPWLSLAATQLVVRPPEGGDMVLMEGEPCTVGIAVLRRLPWPAFMVDVETEWEWAGRQWVLRDTLAVVRAGETRGVGRHIRFPCRGVYRLVAVRLSSGFPLGLVRAHRGKTQVDARVRVWPKEQAMAWPLPWSVAEDPTGELHTRRIGQSMELGMLRPYQHGEPVGRVSWRASARVGELVVQHFQQSGSVRLHVVVDLPAGDALGDARGAGEQAMRLGAGVCAAALADTARVSLHLGAETHPVQSLAQALDALAQAQPAADGLGDTLERVAATLLPGEQLAVVVGADAVPAALLDALISVAGCGCSVVVCIAQAQTPDGDLRAAALERALQESGWMTARGQA